jgi:hypothetical protein
VPALRRGHVEGSAVIDTEAITRAAVAMRGAAEQMAGAASTIDTTLQQQRLFMDDWLRRLEIVLAEYHRE